MIATWAAHKRAIVVEHLLLRPKFPGDALYPALPGRVAVRATAATERPVLVPAHLRDAGLDGAVQHQPDHARFADRTIQEQTPSHLLGKTCWVGNDGYLH